MTISVHPLKNDCIGSAQGLEALRHIESGANLSDWGDVRPWCDCDLEPNPANGRWALQLRSEIPNETIWEWKGHYFSFNDEKIAIYQPPYLAAKQTT